MVYYPLTTLLLSGISEICIVSNSSGVAQFKKLIGDGIQWGLRVTYAAQDEPKGIADGIRVALDTFTNPDSVMVVLGDNIFYGQGLGRYISEITDSARCVIWTQEVNNPENFGIATLDSKGKIISIIEKPKNRAGNLAITGLYHFPATIHEEIEGLTVSQRGEFEITEVLNRYLDAGNIIHERLSRGVYWLDAGNTENLLSASQFVHSVQSRQGYLIGSPDEAAWRMNRINDSEFKSLVTGMPDSNYKESLQNLFHEA
jgi:glucose-1-phosphate thymidylyltransferase